MDYFDCRRQLESALAKLKFPSDCKCREPEWQVIEPPTGWLLELFIDFPDKHIRVWENYGKFVGIQESRRISWSYHYGATSVRDESGLAKRGSPEDPLDIRIDTCGGKTAHLHYLTREPHHAQENVSRLDLNSVTGISFIRAVLKHRKNGIPLDRAFGFGIKKQ